MKRISTITLLTLVSLVAVGNAFAQDHEVKATIPFQFTVGAKLLPSGTYTIMSDMSSPNVVIIRNSEQKIAVLSSAYGDGNESKKNVVVFNKYGDQYFLHEILCSSSNMNLELPTSKYEKRAKLQEASIRNSDQIFVALK